ncbi:MAG: hypothetical protein PHN56_07185 [Candidatus Nanoarchaeia archaeon]|nr:hypothetical protein [Candidatus Nanoarchaeia archaeon]
MFCHIIQNMISWKLKKRRYNFYVYTCAVENLFVDKDDPDYDGSVFPSCNGVMFVKTVTIVENNVVSIYGLKGMLIDKNKLLEEFPVIDDKTPIDDFPEKFAIRTDNIDLIRELSARGKKITWLDPDIIKFPSILAAIPFEHLLINPMVGEYAILPTGESKTAVLMNKKKVNKDVDFSRINNSKVLFSRQIGFSVHDFNRRINFKQLLSGKIFSIIGTNKKLDLFNNNYLKLAYYNILSITYMICKKNYIATNAQKNLVNKD